MRTDAACVDAERLAEYLDGALRAADRREVELHLLRCDACRTIVIEVAMAATATDELSPLEAPRGAVRAPWRRVAVVAASLAAAVVIAVGVHLWPSDSRHQSNGVVPIREEAGVGAGASPQQRALVQQELKDKVARKAEEERFFREQQQTASVSTAATAATQRGTLHLTVVDENGAGLLATVFVRADLTGRQVRPSVHMVLPTDSYGRSNLQIAAGLYDVCVMSDVFIPTCKKMLIEGAKPVEARFQLKVDPDVIKLVPDTFPTTKHPR